MSDRERELKRLDLGSIWEIRTDKIELLADLLLEARAEEAERGADMLRSEELPGSSWLSGRAAELRAQIRRER